MKRIRLPFFTKNLFLALLAVGTFVCIWDFFSKDIYRQSIPIDWGTKAPLSSPNPNFTDWELYESPLNYSIMTPPDWFIEEVPHVSDSEAIFNNAEYATFLLDRDNAGMGSTPLPYAVITVIRLPVSSLNVSEETLKAGLPQIFRESAYYDLFWDLPDVSLVSVGSQQGVLYSDDLSGARYIFLDVVVDDYFYSFSAEISDDSSTGMSESLYRKIVASVSFD